MPRLYSSKGILKVLENNGFFFVSQKGSHVKYCKIENKTSITVIIPANRREIPHGTFQSIVRQSRLDKIDFK